MFDSVTGFGGDGVPGTYTLPPGAKDDPSIFPDPSIPLPPGAPPLDQMFKGCVRDGPFREGEWTLHVGPGQLLITDHCLVRGFTRAILANMTSASVARAMSADTFDEFGQIIDGLVQGGPIHGAGHGFIGGEMSNVYSAGGGEFSTANGIDRHSQTFLPDPIFYLHHAGLDKFWWDWQRADPKHFYDITGPTTAGGSSHITLDFELDFPAVGNNITVRDTVNPLSFPNCFTYE